MTILNDDLRRSLRLMSLDDLVATTDLVSGPDDELLALLRSEATRRRAVLDAVESGIGSYMREV